MKNRLVLLLLTFAAAAHAVTTKPSAPPMLEPLPQQSHVANMAVEIFSRYHYKTTPLDDAMSEKIFDRYMKVLDSEKIYFLQADIDQLAYARTKLDDAIRQQDLHIPFAIFNLYEKRFAERWIYAKKILKQNFDFSGDESYQYDRSKESWITSEDEMRNLWRKRVKNDWLRLKLKDKDDKTIRTTLEKRYDNSLSHSYKYKSEDVFQIFMNAYAMSIEPHTDYLGAKSLEDFDIAMKLSLIGIGALLEERDKYTTIRELIPGGPAALSGKFNVGDRIVGVGQGKTGAMVDVVDRRMDDVVPRIRGVKDTVVRLEILPADAGPDGKHKLITLVRDKIRLEQQAAKKSVIEIKDGTVTRKVGVIALPTFYQDLEARQKGDKNFNSAARDVARLLDELKKDNIDSVVIDLRNNGGGSLDESIELTCLFTGGGPVVQERDSRGNVKVGSCKKAGRQWDGTLAVLINRGSASASEIFAAAIQDYGRGIILGEPSFGKGTVQTMVNLDELEQNDKPKFGALKMTVEQFFRVNGGTTQLRGVIPDVSFPTISDRENFGEASYDNPLPWTQIKAANYTPAGDMTTLLPQLQSRHATRIGQDKYFQYLLEDIAEFTEQRKKRTISLNEAERRKESEKQELRVKLRAASDNADGSGKGEEAAKKVSPAAKKTTQREASLQSDTRNLREELAAEKALKEAKDVWLNEAVNVLADEADLLKPGPKMAASATPAVMPNEVRK